MDEFIKTLAVPSPDSLFGKLWEVVNFEMALKFAILYICIIWIATVVWVIKDITNRTASILLQVLCILLVVLFPFVGIFIYLLIRPSNTLLEKYYGEIEENLDIVSEFIQQHIAEKKAEEEAKPEVKKEKRYQSKSDKKQNKK